jgi:hypothetical protein
MQAARNRRTNAGDLLEIILVKSFGSGFHRFRSGRNSGFE